MKEVQVGDILRYEGYNGDKFAVFMVKEHLRGYNYNVIIFASSMKDVGGPWSLDPAVVKYCTKLA